MPIEGIDEEVKGVWRRDVAGGSDMSTQELVSARQVLDDEGVGAAEGAECIALGARQKVREGQFPSLGNGCMPVGLGADG